MSVCVVWIPLLAHQCRAPLNRFCWLLPLQRLISINMNPPYPQPHHEQYNCAKLSQGMSRQSLLDNWQWTTRVSILEIFFFNFSSRSWVIFISLSLLDLDFQSFLFHFHFLKRAKRKKFHPFSQGKRVKFDTKFHNKINHSRRVQNPKQSTSGIIL